MQNEAVEIMTKLEKIHESMRERYTKVGMERFAGSASVVCHMLYDVVWVGLVTDTRYDEEVAENFMSELQRELDLYYKNKLDFIKRQQNLRPGVYSNSFKSQY